MKAAEYGGGVKKKISRVIVIDYVEYKNGDKDFYVVELRESPGIVDFGIPVQERTRLDDLTLQKGISVRIEGEVPHVQKNGYPNISMVYPDIHFLDNRRENYLKVISDSIYESMKEELEK